MSSTVADVNMRSGFTTFLSSVLHGMSADGCKPSTDAAASPSKPSHFLPSSQLVSIPSECTFNASTRSCNISVSFSSISWKRWLNSVRCANTQFRCACRFSNTTSRKWQWYRCANTWNRRRRILRTIDSNELGNSFAKTKETTSSVAVQISYQCFHYGMACLCTSQTYQVSDKLKVKNYPK